MDGTTKFYMPMCFDQNHTNSIDFPNGKDPTNGNEWIYNCTGGTPTVPTPTGTPSFTASNSFAPATATFTPEKSNSPPQSRTQKATPPATRAKTPSVSRSPSESQVPPVSVSPFVTGTEPATQSPSPAATRTRPQTPTASEVPTASSEGMKTRDIVLVSVGTVIGVGLIIAVVVLCVVRKRTEKLPNLDSSQLYTQNLGDGDPPPAYS
jgi:hypothetical protein